jgi:hypothetical protein
MEGSRVMVELRGSHLSEEAKCVSEQTTHIAQYLGHFSSCQVLFPELASDVTQRRKKEDVNQWKNPINNCKVKLNAPEENPLFSQMRVAKGRCQDQARSNAGPQRNNCETPHIR